MSKPFTSFPSDPEDEETPDVVITSNEELARLHDLVAAMSDACEAALADTLKPVHLQEPDQVIPMLKAAIRAARAALTREAH